MPKNQRKIKTTIQKKRYVSSPNPVITKKKKSKKTLTLTSKKSNDGNYHRSIRPYLLSSDLRSDTSKKVIIGDHNNDGNGAKVDYFSKLLSYAPKELMGRLIKEVDWKIEEIKLFGKLVKSPRMGKARALYSPTIKSYLIFVTSAVFTTLTFY